MTEQQHPITPPPELMQLLRREAPHGIRDAGVTRELFLITAAYRAGADDELEACCEWLHWQNLATHPDLIPSLRTARRPKPPSLKEQALKQLDSLHADLKMHGLGTNTDTIRRALEQLDD